MIIVLSGECFNLMAFYSIPVLKQARKSISKIQNFPMEVDVGPGPGSITNKIVSQLFPNASGMAVSEEAAAFLKAHSSVQLRQ